MIVWVLVSAALLGAVLTAVFGLAGGTVFFAIATWVVSAKEAVPLHSITQLMGNFIRLIAFWDSVRWRIVGYFSLLSLLGAYLGSLCFQYFNAQMLEVLVGIFVLISIFLPEKSTKSLSNGMVVLLGFASSFLGMIVAVTGPLLSAFFVMGGITKEQMISTKAVCQAITQLVKILMFASVIKFDFSKYGDLLLYLAIATLIGTLLGKKVVSKITERQFDILNKAILGIVSVTMILKPLFE